MNETPLFIPLKAEFYDAFARGEKNTEYRQRGPRWNAETCFIGRRVILSRGYGKQNRLHGKIVSFIYDLIPSRLPGWTECYGTDTGDAACIKIELDFPWICPNCGGRFADPEQLGNPYECPNCSVPSHKQTLQRL